MKKTRSSLKNIVPLHNYLDRDTAHLTDEWLSRIIVEGIREAKKDLLDSLNRAFESSHESLEDLRRVRDVLDVFSDELKARDFECRHPPSQEVHNRIQSLDRQIMKHMESIKGLVEATVREIVMQVQELTLLGFNNSKKTKKLTTSQTGGNALGGRFYPEKMAFKE